MEQKQWICANCERNAGKLEAPCDWHGHTVCYDCYRRLTAQDEVPDAGHRQTAKTASRPRDRASPESVQQLLREAQAGFASLCMFWREYYLWLVQNTPVSQQSDTLGKTLLAMPEGLSPNELATIVERAVLQVDVHDARAWYQFEHAVALFTDRIIMFWMKSVHLYPEGIRGKLLADSSYKLQARHYPKRITESLHSWDNLLDTVTNNLSNLRRIRPGKSFTVWLDSLTESMLQIGGHPLLAAAKRVVRRIAESERPSIRSEYGSDVMMFFNSVQLWVERIAEATDAVISEMLANLCDIGGAGFALLAESAAAGTEIEPALRQLDPKVFFMTQEDKTGISEVLSRLQHRGAEGIQAEQTLRRSLS